MARFTHLGIALDTPPMEARLVSEIPAGSDWQFEPKWDGFRCLAFRDGDAAELMSKSGKPLGRYFPEIVDALLSLAEDRLVLDGELILPIGDSLSFADLQMRLHPAASRITKLARETPAQLMLFDCLQQSDDVLIDKPLVTRRQRLEDFIGANPAKEFLLSPLTLDPDDAQRWLGESGEALDGIIAKHRNGRYEPGERAMLKRKLRRTADCVVGGFRYNADRTLIASLLLGLYGDDGRLHQVGFVSSLSTEERKRIGPRLKKLAGPSAFYGKAPGEPSRWSQGQSREWVSLRPELVVEVGYDQVTGHRLRHGASFVRWRPDKSPKQCRVDQLTPEAQPAKLMALIGKTAV